MVNAFNAHYAQIMPEQSAQAYILVNAQITTPTPSGTLACMATYLYNSPVKI